MVSRALAQVYTYGVQDVFEHCKDIKVDLVMNTPVRFNDVNVWEISVVIEKPIMNYFYNMYGTFAPPIFRR